MGLLFFAIFFEFVLLLIHTELFFPFDLFNCAYCCRISLKLFENNRYNTVSIYVLAKICGIFSKVFERKIFFLQSSKIKYLNFV